jgi:alpha/beta superfamily hydrolase
MKILKLTIPGKGVLLDGAAVCPDRNARATVILCHGLPKGLPETGDEKDTGYLGLAQKFAAHGYAAVIFNFRGTGQSTGSLEIAKWPTDLLSVIAYLDGAEKLKAASYGVIGFSAGGATAITAAAIEGRIDPLIACAAPADFDFLKIPGNEQLFFDHYKNVGMIRPDYGHSAKRWAQNFHDLRSSKAMSEVKTEKVFLIHGDEDDTVPVEHAGLLAEANPNHPKVTVLPGAGHQLRKEPVAVDMILSFLDENHLGA